MHFVLYVWWLASVLELGAWPGSQISIVGSILCGSGVSSCFRLSVWTRGENERENGGGDLPRSRVSTLSLPNLVEVKPPNRNGWFVVKAAKRLVPTKVGRPLDGRSVCRSSAAAPIKSKKSRIIKP